MDLARPRHDARRARPARASARSRSGAGRPAARPATTAMTDVPGRAARAARRARPVLHARARQRGPRARRHDQGAVPHRRRPARRGRADALPRRPPLDLRLLAVRLPADLHVLRDRDDEVRPQPDGVGDPRPGPALPPHRAGRPPRVHGHGRAGLQHAATCSTAARRLPDVGITHRRTTVSTVGWLPGIEQLAASDLPIRLALSLHAPEDALRSRIMPVNDRYPIADILAATERYYERRRRMVFIEYVMLAGVNDTHVQARAARGAARPAQVQGQPDPVQPDGLLRRLLARRDRRLQGRAGGARAARDRAAHARPRHRRGLRAARRRRAERRGLGRRGRGGAVPGALLAARAAGARAARPAPPGSGSHCGGIRAGRRPTRGRRA